MCLAYIHKTVVTRAAGTSPANTSVPHKTLPVTALATALLFALFAGSAARADECLALAPGMDTDDDSYYKLETSHINTTERQLEAFATMLSGRWWGKQLEMVCDTENGEIVSNSDDYQIAAEFNEHFQGALRMEAERENSEAVKLSTIWFSPMYRKDRKGHELGWRTYDLSMPNSYTMIFDEKYRVANHFSANRDAQSMLNSEIVAGNLTEGVPGIGASKGFVRLVQDIKILSLKADSSLTIERKIYVSGRLVAEEGWILERDYFGSLSN